MMRLPRPPTFTTAIRAIAASFAIAACGDESPDAYDVCLDTLRIETPRTTSDHIAIFDCLGIDPRTLPHVPIEVEVADPARSLDAATSQAELIMHIRVRTIRYEAGFPGGPTTQLLVDIITVYKGEAASSEHAPYQLQYAGGPEAIFEPGEEKPTYIFGGLNPALYPGDEAILFIDLDQSGHRSVPPGSGQFIVRNGIVEPAPNAPFIPPLTPLRVRNTPPLKLTALAVRSATDQRPKQPTNNLPRPCSGRGPG